jgi:hypothetical protein
MAKERREFADRMIAELRRAGMGGQLEFDEERFRLVLDPQGSLELGNVFAEWERASVLRRGELLRRWTAPFRGPPGLPESVDAARPNLLARVRDREVYGISALQDGPAFTYQPLNEHLTVEIVYDRAESMSTIPPETFEEWGMSIEEALRTARANLRDRTPGTLVPLQPGVFASPWHDNYDSSRLLLTELISRLDVRGDPVALLPHRDHLLVTGSDDEAGLARVAEIAEDLLEETRAETGRAFVWRDGGVAAVPSA